MTETFTKIEDTAKKFAADAEARTTAVFGDMNARAKTAMEKGAKSFEDAAEFNKGNLEAVVASARVAAKGFEEIAKYTAEYGRSTVEKANATAKKFAAVKSPTEFFALQNEIAKTSIDSLVAEGAKFSENYLKLLGEIAKPLSSRYAVAAEKVKTAVAA
ncbi:MAG: phasin family protein [Sphingomonadaceae bacterium]|nr:phasin family protein [Sphingomonadaceae bacterium]